MESNVTIGSSADVRTIVKKHSHHIYATVQCGSKKGTLRWPVAVDANVRATIKKSKRTISVFPIVTARWSRVPRITRPHRRWDAFAFSFSNPPVFPNEDPLLCHRCPWPDLRHSNGEDRAMSSNSEVNWSGIYTLQIDVNDKVNSDMREWAVGSHAVLGQTMMASNHWADSNRTSAYFEPVIEHHSNVIRRSIRNTKQSRYRVCTYPRTYSTTLLRTIPLNMKVTRECHWDDAFSYPMLNG